jgi:thiol-disulfide isomerase/thioredoxin
MLAILWPVMNGYCQNSSAMVQPLAIGDSIPSHLQLTNLENYPVSTIHLSDLKGKLVLLDFWSTWCGSCIEAFPKLQEIQQEFGDSIQIFLVNSYAADTKQKVEKTLAGRAARGEEVKLPYSINQTLLGEYFPHNSVPHYVWVNPDNKVAAITRADEVTVTNIRKMKDGQPLSLHTKKDVLNFDKSIPLGVGDNGTPSSNFQFRSLLTGYVEGIGGSGFERTSDMLITRYYTFNTSARMLLQFAYPQILTLPASQVKWQISRPDLFSTETLHGSGMYKNAYCYDLVIPPSTLEKVQHAVQADLQRFWDIRVDSFNQLTPCLVLQQGIPTNQSIKTGMRIPDIMQQIREAPGFKGFHLIDESGFSGTISFSLPPNFQGLSLKEAIHFLQQQGLRFYQTKRPITFFTITDKH